MKGSLTELGDGWAENAGGGRERESRVSNGSQLLLPFQTSARFSSPLALRAAQNAIQRGSAWAIQTCGRCSAFDSSASSQQAPIAGPMMASSVPSLLNARSSPTAVYFLGSPYVK